MIPLPNLPSLARLGPAEYETFQALSRMGMTAKDVLALIAANVGSTAGLIKADGSTALTGAWNAGNNAITSVNSVDVVNVLEKGLSNDGLTDNTAAFNALVAATAAGTTLYCPRGIYVFASAPASLAAQTLITFRGEAQHSGNYADGTVFQFTGTGAGNFITLGATTGICFERITFDYTSASFSGILVNGDSGSAFMRFDACAFGTATSPRTAGWLVTLDGGNNNVFTACQFTNALRAVRGVNGVGHYSNANQFYACTFSALVTGAVSDPGGLGWLFSGCTFEALTGGTTNAFDSLIASPCQGLAIHGCSFEDASSGTSTWVTLNASGASITGNHFQGAGTTSGITILSTSAGGIDICGNAFILAGTGVTIPNSALGIAIHGNYFNTVPTPISYGTGLTDVWVFGNVSIGGGGAVYNKIFGNVGIGTAAPAVALDLPAYNTTNSQLRVGSFEVQPYALNNVFFADNTYYNGSNLIYRNTGYASLIQFFAGGVYFKMAPSGTGAAVATPVTALSITNLGSVVVAGAALATTATDGFLYIPTCAGPPTGVPTAQTGTAPIVFDSTNNFLYVRVGGTWKKSTVYA